MPTNRAGALQVIDPILTSIARRYQAHGFIGEQLLPDVPVRTLTGQYFTFDKQYWFGTEVELLSSDRSPAVELDFEWDTETYKAERYAAKVSISDVERKQVQPGLRLEQSKAELLVQRLTLVREKRIATILKDSDVTGGELGASRDSTPGINWDQATATIEADIKTAVLDVYDAIGYAPNVIVIPYKVAYAMAVQEDIREILKYTVNGQEVLRLGDRVLPPTLHGMRVVIPMGVQETTSNEANPSPTFSEIWGSDVRCLYVDNAGWGTPTVAQRFVFQPVQVRRWRSTEVKGLEYIEADEWADEKVVAPDAGHIIKAVL
ncbi:MAG: hypothetical protein ACRD2Z_09700 [Thermoanaerobaculia bacterium]